jgi:hypothetical protein
MGLLHCSIHTIGRCRTPSSCLAIVCRIPGIFYFSLFLLHHVSRWNAFARQKNGLETVIILGKCGVCTHLRIFFLCNFISCLSSAVVVMLWTKERPIYYLMKSIINKGLLIFVLQVSLFAQSLDPLQEFVDRVNAKWKLKDYPAIQKIINERLQTNPNDVLALGTKAYFHVFAVNNLKQARASITTFNAAAQGSKNSSAKEIAQSMKDEIFDIPLTESAPLTAEMQEQIHQQLPEFPMIMKVLSVARALTPNSP